KRLLESWLEREVQFFAFPFGDVSSYSIETAAIVRDAGYKGAMTLLPGINTLRQNPFELHRDCLDDVPPGMVMKSWLSGGYDWPNAIRAAVGRRRVAKTT
ncbi:MAG: polysaccharide deacetylase family protein, partial [Actinomycetota bacterium]